MDVGRYFRQSILLVFVAGPLVATVYAMVSLWHQLIGVKELALFLVLYVATGAGRHLRLPPHADASQLRDRTGRQGDRS